MWIDQVRGGYYKLSSPVVEQGNEKPGDATSVKPTSESIDDKFCWGCMEVEGLSNSVCLVTRKLQSFHGLEAELWTLELDSK